MKLNSTVDSMSYDNLLAGSNVDLNYKSVTLAGAQGIVKRECKFSN